jgi:hypothetical protein
LAGLICFWIQLSLAVISGAVLAFAMSDPNFNLKVNQPGSGSGLFFALVGWVELGLSIFWAFRYTRLAERLRNSHAVSYPQKTEVVRVLWQGFILNAVGMFLTLVGVEAIAGTLLAKSLTQVGGLAIYNASQLIQPLDILVIQANVNTIAAQFVGIVISTWLIGRVKHY